MRRLTASALMATALATAGCAGMQPPPGDNAYCAQLFDQYDGIEFLPLPSPPAFNFRQQQLSRIRQAQCLTLSRNLAAMDVSAAAAVPRAAAGPALNYPVAVQAGIVTNMADEARSLAFFQALGYRARTVGAPDLGTRVYVEARSLGDIQNIVSIATNAGFIGPYPSRYVTF
jgi:hypothetical protein